MSLNSNFLKTTSELIESSLEVKSFIHQQILDFSPFITPETLVVVIARDPKYLDPEDDNDMSDRIVSKLFNYRIAIVLKEDESSIEAEASHDDIFEAIKLAKELLILKLLEIQNEMESSQERLVAIQQAANTDQVH